MNSRAYRSIDSITEANKIRSEEETEQRKLEAWPQFLEWAKQEENMIQMLKDIDAYEEIEGWVADKFEEWLIDQEAS